MNTKKLKIIAIVAGVVILINLVIGIVLLTRVFRKNATFVTLDDDQVELIWNYDPIINETTIIKASIRNLSNTSSIDYVLLTFLAINSYSHKIPITIGGRLSGIPPNQTYMFENIVDNVIAITSIELYDITIIRR